jgi:hypothetical protein
MTKNTTLAIQSVTIITIILLSLFLSSFHNYERGLFQEALAESTLDLEIRASGLQMASLESYSPFNSINNEASLKIISSANYRNSSIANLSDEFAIYKNSTFGIQIQYPKDWIVGEETQDFPNDGFAEIVSIDTPLLGRLDTSQERFAVSIDTLPDAKMTLTEYLNGVVDFYNNTFNGFHIISADTNSTIADAHSAYKLVFEDLTDDNVVFRTMEIGTIIENYVYTVNYSAKEQDFSKYLPYIEKMIDSLVISHSFRI